MNCRRLRCDDCRVAGGLCLICGWIRRPMMPQSRAFTRTRRNTACGIQHLRTSRRSPILWDVLCSASAQLPAETRDPDGAIPTTCGGARGRTLPGAAARSTLPGNGSDLRQRHPRALRPAGGEDATRSCAGLPACIWRQSGAGFHNK
jgi:hypothetical protein